MEDKSLSNKGKIKSESEKIQEAKSGVSGGDINSSLYLRGLVRG